MSNGIKIPHPLKREGTYQAERFPEALDYEYIKLDERSLTDLVKQSAEYARFVKYYNELNLEDGNWRPFFEEIYDYSTKRVKFSSVGELEQKASTSPHLALFLAFLRIFNIALENLNSLTEKHLDFYYRHILQLQSRNETPDRVPVFFETDKHTLQALVPAGTTLSAGKDMNGKPLCYVTENDLIVNKAKVASIKSIYVQRDEKKNMCGVHASADAPVDNAVVENGAAAGWLPFGSSAGKKAGIGFAIASPVLNLKEGKRRITIELHDAALDTAKGLTVEYTSEKGWTEAGIDINAANAGQKNKLLYLVVKIDPGQPAVLPYNGKIHQAGLDTVHPVVRFIINNDHFADTYHKLSAIRSGQIKNITVQVSGAKNLLIQNDFGIVDNTKPFPPFGANPVKHKSAVYIGNNDIFNKYLQSFNIALSWKGLPGRIDKYYHTYDFALKKLFSKAADRKKYFDTEQFDEFTPGHPPGKVSILDNGKWKILKMNKDAGYARDVRYDPARDRSLMRKDNRNVFKISELEEALSSGFSYEPLTKFDHDYKSGFIKIDLGYDFGHSKFPKIFASAMLNRESTDFTIPEQPYTPEFESLHIEYTSSAKIDYSENKVFRILAFGNELLSENIPLVAGFDDEGQLLIGLSDISSPQMVSLYFRMENNSGNFEKTINDQNKPRWYYLSGNTWKEFAKSDLLQDTTKKFSGSGIIRFNLSKEAISTHTILSDGMVWLKAAVQADSDAFLTMEAIVAQAVEALFDNRGNDTSHLETGIPANTISKTESKIPGIKKVSQPYNSYGGRAKEENKAFYTRTSERLRHKNRAWTCWDYERLILEKFPSLLKVKCIPHADQDYEYSPGNVFIILLPDPAKITQKCPLQPRVSLSMIEEVKEFIAGNTSPFVQLNVKNPEYEILTVFCDVKLAAGYDDKQFYVNKLNEDLQAFIAPWTNNSVIIPTFSGVLYRSQIINFIEERPYVDYITAFDVKKNGVSCSEAIRGSEENVLLTSSENHHISTEATC
ncbi:MAG TPA: baseplate J/gp47 family protein [Bacteroidales bacterium]|nr:baseplate J/gp47 family protein [Bacteroidales bacterium]HQN16385.1 baseplate J/gp47 family protein [Bacteroidales bacterium]HQP16056.1 baseplate J/gp47 family protein [Bacteroidales bacterium]